MKNAPTAIRLRVIARSVHPTPRNSKSITVHLIRCLLRCIRDRSKCGLPSLVRLNHRRPPYLDVLVGLTENSAVASSVHVDGNAAPNPVHREFGRTFYRRDRRVPCGLAATPL